VKRALALRRWAGLGVIWDATEPNPEPLHPVAVAAPQFSLTVIHVQAGAYLNVGGLFVSPGSIPAVPQQRAAITEHREEREMGLTSSRDGD
jgi:hypothetical protein